MVVVSLTVSPINGPDGEIAGASVIARDVTEQRRAQERAASLQQLTSALTKELSVENAASIVLDAAVPALGADAGTVGLLGDSGDTIVLIGPRGYTEGAIQRWQEFGLDADVPMADSIRTGEPIWSSDPQELLRRYPGLELQPLKIASLVIVPLVVEAWTFGAIALSFREPREFSEEERAFLLAASQQAANALARARMHENERRTNERLAFLAEASEILSGSLELEPTLQRLARIVVPEIADWCVVHLAEDDGLRVVAVAHADPAMVEHAHRLNEQYPVDPDAPIGVPNVIRTDTPELHPEITDEMLVAGAQDEEHLKLLRELGPRSAMVVPLSAGIGSSARSLSSASARGRRSAPRTSRCVWTSGAAPPWRSTTPRATANSARRRSSCSGRCSRSASRQSRASRSPRGTCRPVPASRRAGTGTT